MLGRDLISIRIGKTKYLSLGRTFKEDAQKSGSSWKAIKHREKLNRSVRGRLQKRMSPWTARGILSSRQARTDRSYCIFRQTKGLAGTVHLGLELEARTNEKEPKSRRQMLNDSYENYMSFIKICYKACLLSYLIGQCCLAFWKKWKSSLSALFNREANSLMWLLCT